MARPDVEILTAFTSALLKEGGIPAAKQGDGMPNMGGMANSGGSLLSGYISDDANAHPGGLTDTLRNLIDAMGGMTAMTHSGNAYGGDADMANIRAGRVPAGMSASGTKPQPPTAAQILTSELQAQADSFSKEAHGRIPSAIALANQIDTNSQIAAAVPQQGNSTLNGLLKEKVGTLPKGERYTSTSSNVIQEVDPSTGETIVYATRPNVYTPPSKVIQANVQNQGVKLGFDLDAEMSKLRMLSGTALSEHAGNTMVNIETMMSLEMGNIRKMAAQESGYAAAKAAYDRNIMADEASGHVARRGGPSAETLQARQLMMQSLTASQLLEKSLATENVNLGRLAASRSVIQKIELQRSQQDVRIQNVKDAKEEQLGMLRDTVTSNELANYRVVFGDSGNDDTDKMTIVRRRDKDPVMKAVLGINNETINTALLHPDGRIKDAALKLALQYEKDAPGSTISADAITSPMLKMLKPVIANPDLLIESIQDPERKKELKAQFMRAQGKERADLRLTVLPDLLGRYIETQTEKGFLTDMRTWKSSITTDPNSPIAKIIKDTSANHPQSLAPSGTVIDQFIASKNPGPDGKPLDLKTKLAMLVQGVTDSTNAMPRNLLINNDAVDAMRIRSINEIKNRAAHAYVRSLGVSSGLVNDALEWQARRSDFK